MRLGFHDWSIEIPIQANTGAIKNGMTISKDLLPKFLSSMKLNIVLKRLNRPTSAVPAIGVRVPLFFENIYEE